MVTYCIICKKYARKEEGISIHSLPKDKKTRASWIAFIGCNTSSGVCSKHFKDSDFIYKIRKDGVKRFLRTGVCPSALQNPHRKNTQNVVVAEDVNSGISLRTKNDVNQERRENIESEKSKQVQESIGQVTNTAISDNQSDNRLKRKADDYQESFGTESFCDPRYIGDLRREDFTSDKSWQMFECHFVESKFKQDFLNHKVAKLNKKVARLEAIISHMKSVQDFDTSNLVNDTSTNHYKIITYNNY